jgi:HAD superfamily hydrolase (TIGR01509 family)
MIFDFDGILVDSEPAIVEVYQQMAAREGWVLTEEEYYRDYLALDDRATVSQLYRRHKRDLSLDQRDELVRWKRETYLEAIRGGLPALPGATEFVKRCSSLFPLAIASGSLPDEVEYLLGKLALRDRFAVLSTAEDVEHSKPHPEIYLNALAGLRKLEQLRNPRLEPSQCLAVEDAPAGVDAAHAAGIRCLALAHSRPLEELGHADWVFREFAEIKLDEILKSS